MSARKALLKKQWLTTCDTQLHGCCGDGRIKNWTAYAPMTITSKLATLNDAYMS